MHPPAPFSPPLREGLKGDNPGLVAGNTSSSQWGCLVPGAEAQKNVRIFKNDFLTAKNNSLYIRQTKPLIRIFW
jgi:hypothetical protein